jgi:16S rRNA (guanine527-N7)-methyltransferase
VSSEEFRKQLTARAMRFDVRLQARQVQQLQTYFALLAKWNARINLTSLPLDSPTDATFDRLFLEPLIAARHFPSRPARWVDLGSGGGSPAFPMKVLRPATALTMIESKARKCAFLREASRLMGLSDIEVRQSRFEDEAARLEETVELITLSAVRIDDSAVDVIARMLNKRPGQLWLFGERAVPAAISAVFQQISQFSLLNDAVLTVCSTVSRGTS